IDGDTAEQWLVDNPATLDEENSLQYRFYIFNLENITFTENDLIAPLIMVGGVSATAIIVTVVVVRRRNSKSAIDQ
ncbi:MAG: hypothetical protein ACXABL_15910, partial [Candidatus Thorarchaeota archaeon]